MTGRLESVLARGLAEWVAYVTRRPWLVLLITAASVVWLGLFSAERFSINTDTTDMIAEELPFRQSYKDYKAAFDRLRDPIVVVIDGETPDLADIAADRLAAYIRADALRFEALDQPGGGDFFARNGLLYLDVDALYDLTDRIAAAQPLLAELVRDMSLRGLFDILATASDEIAAGDAEPLDELGDVFERTAQAIDHVLDGRPYYFSWQEVLSGENADLNDRRRFLIVQPVQDFGSLQPSRAPIRELRRLIEDHELTDDNGIRVRLTGSAVLTDDELSGLSRDASLAGLLSFALVALLLFGGLRSPRLVFAALGTILAGLVWTAAFAVGVVGPFNLISIAFAVLFIGLSVDFCIHFTLRYRESLDHGADHRAALGQAAGDVGWALVLCVVADVIAFYAFIPTAYAGMSDLGVISGTGMIIGLFASLTVLPALLSVLPGRKTGSVRANQRAPGSIDGLIRRRAGVIVGLGLLIGIGAAVLAGDVVFDFDPINLRDQRTEAVQTYRDLAADPDAATYTIKVLSRDLETATALADQIDELATVETALTLDSFVPDDQAEKLDIIDGLALLLLPVTTSAPQAEPVTDEDRAASARALRAGLLRLVGSPHAENLAGPAAALADALTRLIEAGAERPAVYGRVEATVLATLPTRLERLAEAMRAQPVTLDTLPPSVTEQFLAEDGRARIEIRPSIDASAKPAMERFVAEVRSVAPDATGGPVLILESGRAVIDAFIVASLIATVLIVGFLVAVLRSAVETGLILIPLLLAGLLTMATAAAIGQPFNFANVIVLPLLLGLGVDSGIHMVVRRRMLADGSALMRTSTPRAVGLSALTTIGSFGTLSISSHQGTASMGLLLTIALAYTLLTTLVILPALLALRQRRRAQSR